VLEHSIAIGPAAIIEVLELQLAEETSTKYLTSRATIGQFITSLLALTHIAIAQYSYFIADIYGSVHPAYNPSFSACFFSRNSIFLSQQISQQCFSAGLSAQPNGA
jgi:hypothetical protein